MTLGIALNTVITILRRTHVQGAEAQDFARAIRLLVEAVHALEKQKEEQEHEHDRDEQKEDV